MARSFTTAPLAAEDIGIAFPIIRAVLPDVSLAGWRDFARRLVDPPAPYPAGAVGLRNEAGYLCGVLTYRIDRDLRHGAVLHVDTFAALDVTGEAAAMRALLLAVEAKAQELRCAAAHVRTEDRAGKQAQHLATSGYHPHATVYARTLPAPASPA